MQVSSQRSLLNKRQYDVVKQMISACKASAKDRGRDIPFNLTWQHVHELLKPMRCSVTGHKLSWNWPEHRQGHCNPWKPSIDRIDPTRGYVVGNVRIVSWIYNLCKSTWTDEVVRQFRGDGPR